MRKASVKALVQFGGEAVDPLIAALKHKKWVVRQLAASALGQIGDSRAVEPLIALLHDTEAVVRELASRSLGAIGDQRAIEALAGVANEDLDRQVRAAAREAKSKL